MNDTDTHIEIYRDTADEWRYRVIARNGRVISDGSEGYYSKWNAKRAVRRLYPETWIRP